MSELEALRRLERAQAEAMRADDPVRSLEEAAQREPEPEIAERLRAAAADRDGLELSCLMVARLRFERLVQGSQRAAEWFERDPASFAQAFRRFHAATPMRGLFPWEHARDFEAFLEREGLSEDAPGPSG